MASTSEVLEVNSKIGLEYIEALKKVIEIRESRCDQYGNSYLTDDFLFLKYQVENKMKRFGLQITREDNVEDLKNIDSALDSAIDAANYCIFMISKILKQINDK